MAHSGVAKALGTPFLGLDLIRNRSLQISPDKAKVQALEESFAHYRRAILALSDADNPQRIVQPENHLSSAPSS
jgi:hypothetical protein